MTKILNILGVFLLMISQSFAADFKSSQEIDADPRGALWNYEFSVKSGILSTPLLITEYACWKIEKGQKLQVTPETWKCFANEVTARIQAQREADTFEVNLVKTNQSTSSIETYRLYHKLIK